MSLSRPSGSRRRYMPGHFPSGKMSGGKVFFSGLQALVPVGKFQAVLRMYGGRSLEASRARLLRKQRAVGACA
jgi:hypothetical protein